MFMPKLIMIIFFLSGSVQANDETYQALGAPIDQTISHPELNLTIFPDGTGLPEGSGSVAQGKQLFNRLCISCHGQGGRGGSAMALTGDIGSLNSAYPEKTVNSFWPYATTLFDYVRRSMPPSAPFSLSSNEIYALCAYVLSQDAILDENAVLDKTTLPQVKMPNRDGFLPR